MSKQILDLKVISNSILPGGSCLMRLERPDGSILPDVKPGQFVEIRVDDSSHTMLRRPISICNVSADKRVMTLFIKPAGDGTKHLVALNPGALLNVILPLGNGFSMPDSRSASVLLVGGGVGAAPLVLLSKTLKEKGHNVTVALGAATSRDLQGIAELYGGAAVAISTDDGSAGHHGLVTTLPEMSRQYDMIYCCGPTPMMRAVAKIARQNGTACEVSLENMMACGLGACLCCVEKTVRGNVCVCTEGPVFNIDMLTWQ